MVKNSKQSGENTEKIWVHRLLAKPKVIAAGGLGRGPGRHLGEGVDVKPLNNFVFFFLYETH